MLLEAKPAKVKALRASLASLLLGPTLATTVKEAQGFPIPGSAMGPPVRQSRSDGAGSAAVGCLDFDSLSLAPFPEECKAPIEELKECEPQAEERGRRERHSKRRASQ